jgi:hypothetical protein
MDERFAITRGIVEAISTLSFLEAWLGEHDEQALSDRAAHARDQLQMIVVDAELSEDID